MSVICTGDGKHVREWEDYAAISSVLTSHRHGDVATRLNIAEASRLVIVTDCRVLGAGSVSIRPICNCERLRAGMRTGETHRSIAPHSHHHRN